MTDQIHIALAFDDNFWAPAYTVMRSICISTHRRQDLVFHLLHMPLSPDHVADLEKITGEYGAELKFYPLEKSELFDFFVAGMPSSAQWPKVVYSRLLVADLLPADIERVIYLDCDMMVRAPIEELYAADLKGLPLGAVRDSLAPFIAGRRDMRQNRDIFDTADPYFNSGMLVIDLAAWRGINVKAEVAVIAGKGLMDRLYFDQDMLNLVFRNRWAQLNWRWNTIDAHPAHEAMDPAILHYTLKGKPWFLLSGILRRCAYARWYRHVMTNDLFYRFLQHRWKRWWKKRLPLLS
jgi:lipopolysaccharide biosynthesis glycosyltransferase